MTTSFTFIDSAWTDEVDKPGTSSHCNPVGKLHAVLRRMGDGGIGKVAGKAACGKKIKGKIVGLHFKADHPDACSACVRRLTEANL